MSHHRLLVNIGKLNYLVVNSQKTKNEMVTLNEMWWFLEEPVEFS